MAVTAGDSTGQVASYANHGSFVDMIAPGTSVITFNGQTYIVTGTSASTAYAAGFAAGVADHTGKSLPQIEDVMKANFGLKNK